MHIVFVWSMSILISLTPDSVLTANNNITMLAHFTSCVKWILLPSQVRLTNPLEWYVCLTWLQKQLHMYGSHTNTPITLTLTGPLPSTLIAFWRMMWQERPPTIVMLTNLKEGKKIKCQQYWPDSGSKEIGPFTVTMTDQQAFADYTVRTLSVKVSVWCCQQGRVKYAMYTK